MLPHLIFIINLLGRWGMGGYDGLLICSSLEKVTDFSKVTQLALWRIGPYPELSTLFLFLWNRNPFDFRMGVFRTELFYIIFITSHVHENNRRNPFLHAHCQDLDFSEKKRSSVFTPTGWTSWETRRKWEGMNGVIKWPPLNIPNRVHFW